MLSRKSYNSERDVSSSESSGSDEDVKEVHQKDATNKSCINSPEKKSMNTSYIRSSVSPAMDSGQAYRSAIKKYEYKKDYKRKRLYRNDDIPRFLKRLRTSSDDDEQEYEYEKTKRRKHSDSCEDPFPSFLKNISITPNDEAKKKKSSKDKKTEKDKSSIKASKISKEAAETVKSEPDVEDESDVPTITNVSDRIIVKKIPSARAEVVVLKNPATITLKKFIKVIVLSGTVSIMGHEYDSFTNPTATFFSTQRTGLVQLSTKHSNPMWKTKEMYTSIKDKLISLVWNADICTEVLESCDTSSVLLVLQRAQLTCPLKMLSIYYPYTFSFGKYHKNNEEFLHVKESRKGIIKFSSKYDDIASSVLSSIRKAKASNQPPPRIIVFGQKNSGKSTLLKYLINRALVQFEHVYYIDTDPGQPEFTPPGVVSISKVDKCVIGPSFSHPRKPEKMIFIGGDSPAVSPNMYLKSIAELIRYYDEDCGKEPLFVNTIGWMSGIGLNFLEHITKEIMPTIVIEMKEYGTKPFFDAKKLELKDVAFHSLMSNEAVASTSYTPKELREHSILAYFGNCVKSYQQPVYINQIKPYCINWDEIAIYCLSTNLPPYRRLQALNGSFVALCVVNESLILKSDVALCRRTLMAEPENTCIGFGIVRAVDETNQLLYIVTPVPLKELKNVNAIIKGNIQIPRCVFIEQPITDRPLPFMDAGDGAATRLGRQVRERKYMA